MKIEIHKKLEIVANIAIIVTASLLCVVLVKKHLIPQSAAPTNSIATNNQIQSRTSEKLSVPGIGWEQNGQTLLLVLSTTCHFCSESAPFYQQLMKERGGHVRIVAVLPQSTGDGEDYLKRLGVSVDEVRQVPLNSINVRGTPTLLLVNNEGVVVNEWIGRLPTEQEAEVLSKVHSDQVGVRLN
jgi:thiol-disulfide isomerase/thioredoxin